VSDVVIRAVDLRKVYRLYAKPSYRFRDMFGLLGHKPSAYTEHAALDGINLEIGRGEKVAIIGRNGAGKSTFLKLVTKVIQPTSGILEVTGHVYALLQIGTGFHPDFTGRQNVYAYLAQLGITGRQADRHCADVIEFAELEEYIDQPVKTYSTGMAVRLMFAASTVISPELLVLDEVLGVGDAYFANKSFLRMKELCESSGTTLLLVTHDIYSAINLCERVVWIDRGRVLIDGDGPRVVKAYEDSIRHQEEKRLRAKKRERARMALTQPRRSVVVEIFAKNNVPQPCPVQFRQIALLADDAELTRAVLDDTAFDEELPSHLVREGTCWGEWSNHERRDVRSFLNYGSPFHKVAAVLDLPRDFNRAATKLKAVFEYYAQENCSLGARWFIDGAEESLGALPEIAGEWVRHVAAPCQTDERASVDALGAVGRQGTGVVVIDDVRAVGVNGEERHQFEHGHPFELIVACTINDPDFRQLVQVQIAFHKDGLQVVQRVLGRRIDLGGPDAGKVVLRMYLDALPLAVGNYSVTVMIVEDGYFDRPQHVFYSINSGVYASVARVMDISVTGRAAIAAGPGVVSGGRWEVEKGAQ
jgi:lipopolysaccharide transport system ATP-binding protein